MDTPSQETIMRWVQGGVGAGFLLFVRWAVRTYLWRKEPDAAIHRTEGEAAERFANAGKTEVESQISLVDSAIKMAQEARNETSVLQVRYRQLEARYRRTVDKVGRQERQIENLKASVEALQIRCEDCERRLHDK